MLLNPRYGVIGMVGMPYFFLFEMLGPVIELSGYVAVVLTFILGIVNIRFLYFGWRSLSFTRLLFQ